MLIPKVERQRKHGKLSLLYQNRDIVSLYDREDGKKVVFF